MLTDARFIIEVAATAIVASGALAVESDVVDNGGNCGSQMQWSA